MDLPRTEQVPDPKKSEAAHSADYAPYPKVDPKDIAPPPLSQQTSEIGSQPADPPPVATPTSTSPQKSVRWSPELTTEAPPPTGTQATSMPQESNPYVSPSPVQSSSKNTMETVRGVLGKWGKKVGEATKKAEDLAGNVWQHWLFVTFQQSKDSIIGVFTNQSRSLLVRTLMWTSPYVSTCSNFAFWIPCTLELSHLISEIAYRIYELIYSLLKTGPSVADAAMGRIAQGTKVIAEGGYEKIFRQTFETLPEEQLRKSYACYLSTSAGPVMGILYLSTAKLAFCSDNPLSYKVGDQTEWSYYKVVIPLHQLKAVNPSASKSNRSEKYIQIISVDGHEFWFMGFVNYDSAVKNLQEALQGQNAQSV